MFTKEVNKKISEIETKNIRPLTHVPWLSKTTCLFRSKPGGKIAGNFRELSLKLTFSHLKMDGWKTILSFWNGIFFEMVCLLVLGGVPDLSEILAYETFRVYTVLKILKW